MDKCPINIQKHPQYCYMHDTIPEKLCLYQLNHTIQHFIGIRNRLALLYINTPTHTVTHMFTTHSDQQNTHMMGSIECYLSGNEYVAGKIVSVCACVFISCAPRRLLFTLALLLYYWLFLHLHTCSSHKTMSRYILIENISYIVNN